jgi:enoyl-CoA hydratase
MNDRTTMQITDGVARITLDDGKVNAMSAEMLEDIEAHLREAAGAAQVTVLAGRPGIFSAGFDMGTFPRGPEPTARMVGAGVRCIEALLAHPHPVLAVCTGHAYPMGAFLLLASDLRYGLAGDFRIGMNETAIGITLPQFAVELARHRLAPQAYARVGTAMMYGPEAAVAMGYLDRVCRPEELEAAVDAAVENLRKLDATSFRATKTRLNARALADVGQAWSDHGFA